MNGLHTVNMGAWLLKRVAVTAALGAWTIGSAACEVDGSPAGASSTAPIVAPSVSSPGEAPTRRPALGFESLPEAGVVLSPAHDPWQLRQLPAPGERLSPAPTPGDAPATNCVDAAGDWQCADDASCDQRGGYWRCRCLPGFAGDGFTCEDVDECATGEAACDSLAVCTNTLGSFACACPAGYEGDGFSCVDVDECALGNTGCSDIATCLNTDGGFACSCPPGYVGDGLACDDVDECEVGEAQCSPLAACSNSPGGYDCQCPAGFEGDGFECVDIDECEEADVCAAGATCGNQVGSFACACAAGSMGDAYDFCLTAAPAQLVIAAGATSVSKPVVELRLQEAGNLLKNAGAEVGSLTGWTLLEAGGKGFAVWAGGFLGVRQVASSNAWSRRGQLVDLLSLGFSEAALDAAPPIVVREWAAGSWPSYDDLTYLRVELRDANGGVLASFADGSVDEPRVVGAAWTASEGTLSNYGAGLRYIWIEDGARDAEGWAGHYGAVLDAASVVIGESQVRVSNDGTSWSEWAPFKPTMTWTLEEGAGLKTVHVQVRDAWGGIHEASDGILLK